MKFLFILHFLFLSLICLAQTPNRVDTLSVTQNVSNYICLKEFFNVKEILSAGGIRKFKHFTINLKDTTIEIKCFNSTLAYKFDIYKKQTFYIYHFYKGFNYYVTDIKPNDGGDTVIDCVVNFT